MSVGKLKAHSKERSAWCPGQLAVNEEMERFPSLNVPVFDENLMELKAILFSEMIWCMLLEIQAIYGTGNSKTWRLWDMHSPGLKSEVEPILVRVFCTACKISLVLKLIWIRKLNWKSLDSESPREGL